MAYENRQVQSSTANSLPTGTDPLVDNTASGDVQAIKVLDGTAGSTTPVNAGGGVEANALRVTIASDSTGVVSVDDNGTTLSIDDGGGNISIDDGGNTITVDGTVAVSGTVTVGSHAVTNAGTFAVQVDAAIPAGNNNIGDVDVASIAAGDNNIGNVDIVTMPNVTLAAGTNTNEVVGDAAHDAAVAGNPLLMGAYASAAAPSDVSGDGDAVRIWADRAGRLQVGDGGATLSVDDGGSTLSIDDGGSTITVDGTVTVTDGSGSLTVDGTVAATQSGTWTVQPGNTANSTAWLVTGTGGTFPITDSGGNISIDDGGNTITVDGTVTVTDGSGSLTVDGTVAATQSGTWSVRLTDGTDTADVLDLTNSNPLTVAIVDGDGTQLTSFGGGTQYTEGDTDASITGTAILWEAGSNTLRPASAATPLPVEIITGGGSGGTATADDSDFNQGSTNATPAMGVYESTPTNVTDNDMGIVGITQTRAMRVRLDASTNTQEVVGDAAHDAAVAGNPVLMGGYASAAAPSDVSGDGDVARLWTTVKGALNVADAGGTLSVDDGASSLTVDNAGTFAVQVDGAALTALQLIDNIVQVEDGAHSSGHSGVMGLTVRQDTAAALADTDADYQPLITDASGRLHVNVGNTVTVGSHAVTNAGTFATQVTSLPASTNTIEVVGDAAHDAGVAGNPVLMGGYASAAAPSDVSGDGDVARIWTTVKGAVNVADAGGSLTVDGTVTANLAAGTNNIGDVDILSIAAGDNNIGNVDIVSLPASTNTIEIVGDAAHDAAIAGNPVRIGARSSAAALSDVSADNETVDLWALRNGALAVQPTFAGVLGVAGNGGVGTGVQRVTLANDSTGVLATVSTVTTLTGSSIAHDGADSGNPHKIGAVAIAHGANPTAVAAADRTNLYANRAGILWTIGGHPNVLTLEAAYTAAQTDTAIVSVSGGTIIVVTQVQLTCDNANTVDVGARVGFGTANTPTTTGVVLTHPGIAPGSGVSRGDGSGVIGIGADGSDLRITCEVPTTGSIRVLVDYFTIES